MPQAVAPDTLRRVRRVQRITVAWVSIEAAVSLVVAWQARSPALLSVGRDSAIELASAVVVLWRFRTSAAPETMRRVMVNILALPLGSRPLATPLRTRLTNSPGPKARRQITQLEKIAGILPLSVRSMKWWALLIGRASIRGLAPRTNSVTPDALVVFPIQDALDECESGWREVGDPAIVIAPDDLRKSDTSAGPPYEIAIPDLNADGKLLDERHDLYFVDYLRTAFRFGGFSGSDGIDPLPQELSVLKESLVSF